MEEALPHDVQVNGDRPRIFLEKVVLENFKSYSGVTTVQPFHTGFTAVVGPNGSGKSNLLEALIFAFGKRARKIRLSNLPELIHKSNFRRAADFASVTVYLRTINTTTSVKITRVILAKGVSVYKIDDSTVTQEEVMNRLSTLGIDIQHNRFMILQGEVEMISSMPPKCGYEDDQGKPVSKEGLLEYFDDLIGTKPFHYVLKDVQALINDLCEKLPGLNTRHQIEMQRKTELNEPMRKIVKYIRMHLDYFRLKNVDLHFKKHVEEEKLKEIETKSVELKERKTKAENKHKALKDKHKDILEAINKLKKEKREAEDLLTEKKKQFEDFGARHNELTQEQTSTTDKFRKSKDEDEAFKRRSTKFKIELADALKESKQYELKHETETSELKRVQTQLEPLLETINSELQPFQSELSSVWQQRLTSEEQKKAIEAELQNTKAEKQALEQRVTEGKQTQEQVATRLKQMQKELAATEQQYAELNTEEDELRPNIQHKEASLVESEKMLKAFEQELASAQAKLSKASRTARKNDCRNDFHTRISNAMRTGKLPGVLGRLGDLGHVQKKLDVAISTAFHGHMESYVARTVQDAEAFVEYMREEQIGRVTILVLEKLRDVNTHFQTPDPAAVRIFDEIRISDYPEVAKAFYHVFRDTLITKDLENARRIAFELEQRWQVVTASGEVVRPSGEMQGFASPRSGSIKVIGTSDMEVEEVDNDALQIEIGRKNEKMKTLVAQLQAEKSLFHKAVHRLQTLQIEKITCADKLKVLKSEIERMSEDAENGLSTDQNAQIPIRDFVRDIRNLDFQLTNTNRELDSLQQREDSIQQRMNFIKSPEVQELETTVKKFQLSIETIELNQGKVQYTIERLSRKVAVLQDKMLQNELKMKSYEEKLTQLKQDIEITETKAKTLVDEVNDLKQNIDSCQEQLKKKETDEPVLKRKFEKLSNRIRNATSALKDLENERLLQLIKVKTWVDEIQSNRTVHDEKISIYEEVLTGLSLGEGPEADGNFFSLESKRTNKFNYQRYLLNVHETVDLEQFGSKVIEHNSYPPSSQWQIHQNEVEHSIQSLEEKLQTQPDFIIATQFREITELIKDLEEQISKTNVELSAKRVDYMRTRKERLDLFMSACQRINASLKQIYSIFTDTGAAEIEFLDSADPFADGLYISVRPPGKSWKKLSSLSGGEKTLVSLSLIFALHEYKPNSIYIMDEIDASLDFINVQKVAEYIRRRRETAQFVVVSLRAQMFEKADQLVGIYKIEDCSSVISICPSAVELQPDDAQNPIIQNILS